MPDPGGDLVDVILADGVVAASVVVGRVLLAADHGRGVEEVLVSARRDLVNHGGLEVDEDGPEGDSERKSQSHDSSLELANWPFLR